MGRKTARLLFAGYGPVHFVCFRPLYERLRTLPGVEVWFSGGREIRMDEGVKEYDLHALYAPFDVPKNRLLTIEKMREQKFDMVFSAHTSGFFPRKRCTRVQIFHGVSFRNMAIRPEQMKHDHFFIIGPYMRRGFMKRRILPKGDRRALEIGFPKLDCLRDGSLDRNKILREVGLKGDRPVLLYAPTGAKYNSMETMGEDVLRRLKAEDRYDIIVKPHDHPKKTINWFEQLAPLEDAHFKVVRGFDVVPLLFVANLLISDASSVGSEFTLMDRPIIWLDVPKLLSAVRRKRKSMDLQTYGRHTGITVRKPADVPKKVAWFLDHPGHRSSARRAMSSDLFYGPGTATDRAMDWILKALSRRGIGPGLPKVETKRGRRLVTK